LIGRPAVYWVMSGVAVETQPGEACGQILGVFPVSTADLFTAGGCGGAKRRFPRGGAAYRILVKL
jgi:hypothetical protein